MIDMTKTIAPKSDQLNADDLLGKTLTIKITNVTGCDGEQPVAISFDGDDGKPYKPCKSMRRVLVKAWGRDGHGYIGKSMTLYCDDKVKFGGVEVGGIRISHMSDIADKFTMALTASKAVKKPYVVHPLSVSVKQPSQETVDAGNLAAGSGVEGYKAWLSSLPSDVKETVKSHHSSWSKVAKDVDLAKLSAESVDTETGEITETKPVDETNLFEKE